jgi:multidrug resistance efflux pump
MDQSLVETTNRKMHSRIAHIRALKDNVKLARKHIEQVNNSLPMILEPLQRTAAVNQHRFIARPPLPNCSIASK